ncbi:MAG: LacI family DNA-binding transcriptional regulator, partial [Flavitalea sp.]
MSRLVTINDIARELNTTPATVSRALNNHRSISEEKKKLIVETAERLNYRRNSIASSLRLGHTKVLGVIIPSAEINFFGRVVHGIENHAAQNGYNVLIFQSNEMRAYEVRGIETLLSARVDGIMVSIAKDTADYSHFLMAKKSKTPIIFFDRVNN